MVDDEDVRLAFARLDARLHPVADACALAGRELVAGKSSSTSVRSSVSALGELADAFAQTASCRRRLEVCPLNDPVALSQVFHDVTQCWARFDALPGATNEHGARLCRALVSEFAQRVPVTWMRWIDTQAAAGAAPLLDAAADAWRTGGRARRLSQEPRGVDDVLATPVLVVDLGRRVDALHGELCGAPSASVGKMFDAFVDLVVPHVKTAIDQLVEQVRAAEPVPVSDVVQKAQGALVSIQRVLTRTWILIDVLFGPPAAKASPTAVAFLFRDAGLVGDVPDAAVFALADRVAAMVDHAAAALMQIPRGRGVTLATHIRLAAAIAALLGSATGPLHYRLRALGARPSRNRLTKQLAASLAGAEAAKRVAAALEAVDKSKYVWAGKTGPDAEFRSIVQAVALAASGTGAQAAGAVLRAAMQSVPAEHSAAVRKLVKGALGTAAMAPVVWADTPNLLDAVWPGVLSEADATLVSELGTTAAPAGAKATGAKSPAARYSRDVV